MMFVTITSIIVITMTQIRPKENQQFRNPQRSYLQVHKGREGEMEKRRGTRRTDKDKETGNEVKSCQRVLGNGSRHKVTSSRIQLLRRLLPVHGLIPLV